MCVCTFVCELISRHPLNAVNMDISRARLEICICCMVSLQSFTIIPVLVLDYTVSHVCRD